MKKFLILIVVIFFLQSCSSSRKAIEINNSDKTEVVENITNIETIPVIVTETSSATLETIDETIPAEIPGFGENGDVDIMSMMDSDIWDQDLTEVQEYLINRADSVYEKKAYLLLLTEGDVEVELMIYDDQVKVLMSLEDEKQINHTYNMVSILEDLIEKYNIETELNLTIVSSLTQEVMLLDQKISILNNKITNKDGIIYNLDQKVVEMGKSYDLVIKERDLFKAEVQVQKKEVKRQKRQKNAVAIGSGTLLLLILALLF